MPGVVNRVAGGRRSPSRKLDISLVVSGGVDCGRRRRNVYDKKPRRYAKDNRTAHLTARSDQSVASTRRFVLLKLTTDRHEASRGLFVTRFLGCFCTLPQIRTTIFCEVVRLHTEDMVESIIWILLEFSSLSTSERILNNR